METTHTHLATLSCCSAPTPPVVRVFEDPPRPYHQDKLSEVMNIPTKSHGFPSNFDQSDFMMTTVQNEFASFRKAWQNDLAMANDRLQGAIEQLLCTSREQERAAKCVTAPMPDPQAKLKEDRQDNEARSTTLCANGQFLPIAREQGSTPNAEQIGAIGANPNACDQHEAGETTPIALASQILLSHQVDKHDHGQSPGHQSHSVDDDLSRFAMKPTKGTTATEKAAGSKTPKGTHDHHRNIFFIGSGSLVNMEDLDLPIYNVSQYYHETGVCRSIAASDYFQNLVLFMICLNSLYLGLDANENDADSLLDADWYFFIAENFFCVFFTVEWLVRFGAFENKRDCLKDKWFKFDSALAALMILETWLILIVVGSMSLPTGPLRLFRLLRLARLTRIMRSLPELVTMVKGLAYAIRAVGSSLLLIVSLVYVFAIAMHSVLKNSASLRDNFRTLPRCMWTLLLDGVFMDSTGVLLWRMINNGEVLAIIAFLSFILLAAMTVMNMLIGVLCEVVSAVSSAEKENIAICAVKHTLLSMLKTLDTDGSGDITKEELEGVLKDHSAMATLQELQVDLKYLFPFFDMLFSINPVLTIPHILEVILAHRGDRQATVQDVIFCHDYTRWSLGSELKEQTKLLKHVLHRLDGSVSAISGASKHFKNHHVEFST